MRLVKARTDSPVARFLGSLTSNELVEVERRRVTTLFASNEGLSQRPQADLTILKQPQGRPHNVAGRAVTAGSNLILDERAEMLIKAERRIPTHMQEGTNSWYRWLAPPLLVILRRVLREPEGQTVLVAAAPGLNRLNDIHCDLIELVVTRVVHLNV